MNAGALLEQAREHEREQSWPEALAAYSQALEALPGNVEAHAGLGSVCRRLGRLAEAEQHYRFALNGDPAQIAARYNLGMLYRQQGRREEAQAELEEFLAQARDSRDVSRGKALLADLTGQAYHRCSTCGRISTLPDALRWTIRGKVCPHCQPRYRALQSAVEWSLIAGFGALTALLTHWVFPEGHFLMINVVLAAIMVYLLIVPHELCHALAARLLGARVFEIRVGLGPAAWEKRLGSLTLSLGRIPIGGQTTFAFPGKSRLRARMLVATSAGMAFNGLVILAMAPLVSLDRLTTTYALWEAFLLSNLMSLVANLLPYNVSLGAIAYRTDGMWLLQLLFGKLPAGELQFAYFASETLYALQSRRFADAVAASEAGLACFPESTILKNAQAVALLEMEQHREALDLFQESLAGLHASPSDQQHDPGLRADNRAHMEAILLNNVAYASLLVDPAGHHLQQACTCARQAFRLLPWVPSIQGTWGSTLVEMGQLAAGVSHLTEAARHHDTARAKASCLAYAAIGCSRLGQQEQAATLLKRAQKLDATQYIVRKAAASVRP